MPSSILQFEEMLFIPWVKKIILWYKQVGIMGREFCKTQYEL